MVNNKVSDANPQTVRASTYIEFKRSKSPVFIGEYMDLGNGKALHPYLGLLLFLLVFVPAWGQDTSGASPAAGDNSKINQQDRQSSAPTADQQKNDSSDLQLTREIRQSLMKEKSLSTYAHNLKVISQNGKVTLKGPVRSEDERDAVLAKATQVAGEANVNDEMTIVPKH
jgi:hyperosmotically inducible periplasmic protein